MKVLVEKYQNPLNRQVIQTSEMLYVLSECCNAPMRDQDIRKWADSTGKYKQEKWQRCTTCMDWLRANPRGYTATIELTQYIGTRPESWSPWGYYMLGMEDFAMEIV